MTSRSPESRSKLAQYASDPRPIWVWDLNHGRIISANRAGIAFWGETSLSDLSLRDFGANHPVFGPALARLTDLEPGQILTRDFIVFPRESAVQIHLELSAIQITAARPGILMVGTPQPIQEIATLPFESLLYRAPVPLVSYTRVGAPLFQNMAADDLFGPLSQENGTSNLVHQIVDPAAGQAMMNAALAYGSCARVIDVDTPIGPARQRVALSQISDPQTNEILLIAAFEAMPPVEDIDEMVEGARIEPSVAVSEDNTNWPALIEELTRSRDRAEESSNMKSAFLANISHELRTPLNAILGFAEIMMQGTFGPINNERYRDYLSDIHSSGSHVLSLVNDLLDMSKAEAGRIELHIEPLDLGKLIKASERFIAPQVLDARVLLKTMVADNMPRLKADPRSLRQVLINLVSNAVKFTPEGGTVTVRAGLSDRREMIVEVADTGPGMSPEQVATALEPYRQVGDGEASSRGTGLGLPIARAITEAHGAQFMIESKLSTGTIVRLVFPESSLSAL